MPHFIPVGDRPKFEATPALIKQHRYADALGRALIAQEECVAHARRALAVGSYSDPRLYRSLFTQLEAANEKCTEAIAPFLLDFDERHGLAKPATEAKAEESNAAHGVVVVDRRRFKGAKLPVGRP